MYKKTFFDKHGPDAGNTMRETAWSFVTAPIGIVLAAFIVRGLGIRGPLGAIIFLVLAACFVVLGFFALRWPGKVMSQAVLHAVAGGSTTPYEEQFSFEQALVMQRKYDEALRSFEEHIAKPGSGVEVRRRAAELYAKEGNDPKRAAELFRAIQAHPACTVGQYAYATNRLVDLLTGPLADPGRALVELRRLIDRYPGSPAAAHARIALAEMKKAPLSS